MFSSPDLPCKMRGLLGNADLKRIELPSWDIQCPRRNKILSFSWRSGGLLRNP